MLDGLKTLLGMGSAKEDEIRALAEQGAPIVDVRSPAEFAAGHIPGSLNIPLDRLSAGVSRFGKEQPLIVCCASGMRSGMAKRSLEAAGHGKVVNGGSWRALQGRLGK